MPIKENKTVIRRYFKEGLSLFWPALCRRVNCKLALFDWLWLQPQPIVVPVPVNRQARLNKQEADRL